MLKTLHRLASAVRQFATEGGTVECERGGLSKDERLKMAQLHSLCIGNVAFGRLGAPLLLSQGENDHRV
jgi:hypothetical protein